MKRARQVQCWTGILNDRQIALVMGTRQAAIAKTAGVSIATIRRKWNRWPTWGLPHELKVDTLYLRRNSNNNEPWREAGKDVITTDHCIDGLKFRVRVGDLVHHLDLDASRIHTVLEIDQKKNQIKLDFGRRLGQIFVNAFAYRKFP